MPLKRQHGIANTLDTGLYHGYQKVNISATEAESLFTGNSISKPNLYNNTCSFCIFIGRELCVIKVHTHG